MNLRVLLLPVVVAAFAATVRCQQPAPTAADKQQAAQDPSAGKRMAEEMRALFAKEKIELDLAKGTVTVQAVVNAPPDAIEYLLIYKRGKKHESMFITESKPSVLNSAFLLIGMTPGKNAVYKEKDPAPTLEEVQGGVDPVIVLPPEGNPFWITVSWSDDQGNPVELCVEELIADLATQAPVRDASFVYLGGRMASLYKGEPQVYVADFEGNLLSLCYLTPDNHLGTMRHERSRDDENWWYTSKLPEAGKQVRLCFHREKPELAVARERRLAAEDKAAADQEKKPDAGGGEAGK